MSIRLYVGNLPEEVNRQDLEAVFSGTEEFVSLKLITDRKTGKCRGFGFLTVGTTEAADVFIEKFNGLAFKEISLRVEKAQPKTKPEKGEGETEGGEAPTATAEVTPPVRTTPPVNISRPVRKPQQRDQRNDRNRSNRDNNAPRPERVVSTSDDAGQPDPRWAEALRNIRKQLTKA
jgi:RNA recognition motif-containing protein